MNYFWLKKKAFLGSFVKNYIFITVLCFYSSKYSTSLVEMAQSPTFELETDNIILKMVETEAGDVSLNYIVEFSPEEIVYNKDYSSSVTLTAGEYLEVYPKIVTYGDYLFDLRSGIGQVSSDSFGLDELTVKDKIGFYVNAELEDGHSLYINNVYCDINTSRELENLEVDQSDTESVGLVSAKYLVHVNSSVTIDELFNHSFSLNDAKCKTNYALESGIDELNSLHADLQTTKYIGNVDVIANFGMFYTNQLLNGLRVEYSKSIINYVNIGSNESSNISLSALTINDGIELVQGISSIGALSMPLRTMYAKDNYSISISGLELETYMKFYNLNGLKVSDLDGLVFSDLMFN